jgi:hypothetical protein
MKRATPDLAATQIHSRTVLVVFVTLLSKQGKGVVVSICRGAPAIETNPRISPKDQVERVILPAGTAYRRAEVAKQREIHKDVDRGSRGA